MNWKAAAIGGGTGFVLSFLSGLIGGVPLLDVMLRALLWALVLGGAVIGIEALLRSQLPELFETPPPAAGPEETGGTQVDITLGQEAPELPPGASLSVDEGEPDGYDEVMEDGPRPAPRPEMAAAAETRTAAPEKPAPAAGGEDEVLPELGAFMESFKASGNEPDLEAAPLAGGVGAPAKSVNIDGEEHDPSALAQAVKTVLKRDQQG